MGSDQAATFRTRRSQQAVASDAPPVTKRAKVEQPEAESVDDLEVGAVVLYWDGSARGVIRDAFVPLDEYWLTDEESGQLVRDESGDVIHFKSAELEIVARPPIAPARKTGTQPPAGVLVIGSERHMMKILNHFGNPDCEQRHQPQQLLAMPCHLCDENVLAHAVQGVAEGVLELAQELRPDIQVAVRAYHLKQAAQELGKDLLRMEDFYILTSLSVPFSWEDIEACSGWHKKWRRDVCNQLDVGPTARGFHVEGDSTSEDTARRILGCEVGVEISLLLWDDEVQKNIREKLAIDLPLQFVDANDGRISVIILPNDATARVENGILRFAEALDADYLGEGSRTLEEELVEEVVDDTAPPATVEEEPRRASSNSAAPQGKTIAQWEKEQDQFAHLPAIPPEWVRVKSKSGQVYFFNKKTKEATFEMPEFPLPPGWTKQTSKSTGKTYYFHAGRRKSQFDRPTQ